MRDLVHAIRSRSVVTPATLSATANGATVDRLGFESVTFLVQTGPGGITFTSTNRLSFAVEESDDGTTWSTPAVGSVIGDPALYTAAKAAATVDRIGYVGGKRYVRCNPTFGGTHGSGTAIGITAVLSHASERPVL